MSHVSVAAGALFQVLVCDTVTGHGDGVGRGLFWGGRAGGRCVWVGVGVGGGGFVVVVVASLLLR